MICELHSIYMIIQFFSNVLQARNVNMKNLQDVGSSQEANARLNITRNVPEINILANPLNSILIEKLTRRFKRAPNQFPRGFPSPGPGAYPHSLYPGEYAYPPGHAYGNRPYPPTYEDYMTDNQRRQKAMENYQSIGYITSQQMLHMVTEVLYDFFAASTLGQYHGGFPLDTSTNRAISWLTKKIHGYVEPQWTTEEPPFRPPQWAPPKFQKK